MKLSKRERHILSGGALVVALTVLVAWVFLPLGRRWSRMGGELGPKLRALAVLKHRAEQHELLLAERARLVERLGSLLDAPTPPEAAPQEANDAPEEQSEDASASSDAPDADQPPQANQEAQLGARSLEVLLEKAVQKSGGRVKRISAKRNPTQAVRLKHFKMTTLEVETDFGVESLVKLLHALEKGPRLIRVNSLKVRHDFNKPGAVSITLDVAAYELADQT